MFTRLFSRNAERVVTGTVAVGALAVSGWYEQRKLDEFNRKFPGETPEQVINWASRRIYFTYRRQEVDENSVNSTAPRR